MKDYKKLHEATMRQCCKYVEAFCEIMGYVEDGYMPEYYFIGLHNPDMFGIVTIGDMFFNMSDLCVVIGEYDHWKDKYGDDLPKVIEEWYWYHIGESDKWGFGDMPKYPINLEHWLMGARPTEQATSQEYKEQRAKELEEARRQVEETKEDLLRMVEEEYHHKMTYQH